MTPPPGVARPSSTSGGVLAGVASAGWGALLQFAAVPIYLRLLGAEGYGLIGFYVALAAALRVLDLGLSATLNRELARSHADVDGARHLTRTLEIVYGVVGVIIGLTLMSLSGPIATRWIRADVLPVDAVRHAIALIGLLIAVQWPLSMYQGGVMGLQRLVPLHAVNAAAFTLSVGGGIVVLLTVSRTVGALLTWQLLVALVQLGATAWLLWRSMPAGAPPRFQFPALRRVGAFAAGIAGITALGSFVSQADKIVLSRTLPLAEFGYYSIAATVAAGLSIAFAPVFNAIFPRLSSLLGTDARDELTILYRRASQGMAALVMPMAVVIIAFAPELILLWTRDARVTASAAPVTRLLVAGAALHALVHLPYALQLAAGWTRPALLVNLVGLPALLALLVLTTPRFGGVAAGWIWIAYNTAYLMVMVPLTHTRVLGDGMLRWILRDVGAPTLAVCVSVAMIAWLADTFASAPLPPLAVIAVAATAILLATAMAIVVAPEVRTLVDGWRRAAQRRMTGSRHAA